eukprot:TRINITY_DN12419_c0_g1_i2.p1 TRINITY_DN12419_c0_g1~~TRINITY_DN12419_c0_g1_i2.p1  ORF type:complete len:178 (+),score=35.99 TRINITY_DN12419_c0_g1_i2:48-581(+)
MARSRSMLLMTATVAIAMLSCIAFVQVPVIARADRLVKFQTRGAAAEDVATDAPDARKSSRGPAVLAALAALGLLAALLSPQGTTAFIDEVASMSSKTSNVTRSNFTGADTTQVKTDYVAISSKKENDPQSARLSPEFGDESRFVESASCRENSLQENANQLDLEAAVAAACYPGFC